MFGYLISERQAVGTDSLQRKQLGLLNGGERVLLNIRACPFR
jgi:hypothetical protein